MRESAGKSATSQTFDGKKESTEIQPAVRVILRRDANNDVLKNIVDNHHGRCRRITKNDSFVYTMSLQLLYISL